MSKSATRRVKAEDRFRVRSYVVVEAAGSASITKEPTTPGRVNAQVNEARRRYVWEKDNEAARSLATEKSSRNCQ